MVVPAAVTVLGALVLIPLSPALIFGFGPLPQLGVAGGAAAVVLYYTVGSAVFAAFIWSGRGVLRPPSRVPRLQWAPAREILRVGAVSSLVSVTTNVSIATATGFAGSYGPAAAAGFGTGARLEYLLVPLVFGLGAPLAAMVGTCIGAGERARALRVAWTGAAIAGALTEAIGIAGALFPRAWLSLFGDDAAMIAIGSDYLRIVGPFYGFFGIGLSLYFASQGAGRLGWPLAAASLRLAIAVAGGFLALRLFGIIGVFWALAVALAAFGMVIAAAIAAARLRLAVGTRIGDLLPPQPCRREIRALADRRELEPDDRLDHPFAVGEGAEAAVGGRDDALAVADRRHRLGDAARDHLRMLDEIAGGLDHAGDEDHVLGERHLPERIVFVRMARVGELDRERADPRLIERRQNLRERDVVDVRAFPVAVAHMQPHALARDALDALVDRGNMQLAGLDEIGLGEVAIHHGAVHREVGGVDLQDQAGFRDRPVFLAHLARDGIEIGLLRIVIGIEHGARR